jgi:hypothetical protein
MRCCTHLNLCRVIWSVNRSAVAAIGGCSNKFFNAQNQPKATGSCTKKKASGQFPVAPPTPCPSPLCLPSTTSKHNLTPEHSSSTCCPCRKRPPATIYIQHLQTALLVSWQRTTKRRTSRAGGFFGLKRPVSLGPQPSHRREGSRCFGGPTKGLKVAHLLGSKCVQGSLELMLVLGS